MFISKLRHGFYVRHMLFVSFNSVLTDVTSSTGTDNIFRTPRLRARSTSVHSVFEFAIHSGMGRIAILLEMEYIFACISAKQCSNSDILDSYIKWFPWDTRIHVHSSGIWLYSACTRLHSAQMRLYSSGIWLHSAYMRLYSTVASKHSANAWLNSSHNDIAVNNYVVNIYPHICL